jgi:uncharacterized protein (TIGR03000 family)
VGDVGAGGAIFAKKSSIDMKKRRFPMIRQWLLRIGSPALAMAALLLAAGLCPAYAGGHGGGGHGGGGGGHGGGGHGGGGGGHGGGGHGGWGGGHGGWGGGHGGWGGNGSWHGEGHHGGNWGWGYPWGYGVGLGLAWGLGRGWGYPGYYGDYGYGDYGYGYGPGYYDSGYSYAPSYSYAPNYYGGSYADYAPAPGAGGQAGAAPPAIPNLAHLRLLVPDGAQVWIEDAETSQTGPVRYFHSPSLSPDKEYAYHLKAQWQQDGRTVSRERDVTVHVGDRITVDFNRLAQAGPPPRPQPAVK